jgi:mannose-6-phosphate isomerase-like protein (cupin superfamily)
MAANAPILPPGMRSPPRRTLTNPLIKDKVIFEKYGIETGGEYTQVRVTVSPGGGTPLHYHTSYEEHMVPQRGTLGVVIGEESKRFEVGEKAVVPGKWAWYVWWDEMIGDAYELREGFHKVLKRREPWVLIFWSFHIDQIFTWIFAVGTKHRFFNPAPASDPSSKNIEFLAKVVPAHENFEKSIYICYGLANDGLCDEKGLPKSIVDLCLMGALGDMKWPGITASLGNTIVKAVAAYGRWSGEEERLLKKYWHWEM